MKIQDVLAHVLEPALRHRFPGRSAGPGRDRRCWSRWRPLLLGADALATEAIWYHLYAAPCGGEKGARLSAIDIAQRSGPTSRS